MSDIYGYTMDQVIAFSEAANRNRNKELYELAITTRMAFHAEGKDWGKYIDTLIKDMKPVEKKKDQGLSRGQAQKLRMLLGRKL